tara:strand:+ start:347 stop:478 length:132 start_codon:yes stop_codon:yes gene_type:complete
MVVLQQDLLHQMIMQQEVVVVQPLWEVQDQQIQMLVVVEQLAQ